MHGGYLGVLPRQQAKLYHWWDPEGFNAAAVQQGVAEIQRRSGGRISGETARRIIEENLDRSRRSRAESRQAVTPPPAQ